MSKTPLTMEALMAQALEMEREAAQRYAELADAMETHHNLEVAQMFRTMAGYEAKHAEKIVQEMGGKEDPSLAGVGWPGREAPEVVPHDAVHYLMHPWHALQLALAAELRAEAFFSDLARQAATEAVRRAAMEMQAEEAEHAALVRQWLAKVPEPPPDWSEDPDPPRYNE